MNRQTIFVALGGLLLTAVFAFAEPDIMLDLFLQPWSTLEQNDAWRDNGDFGLGLHRAEAALRTEKKIGAIEAAGKLRLDFAQPTIEDALQNAWVSLSFRRYLRFKAGKFKVPFGANSLVASKHMTTVYHSFTTEHLQSGLYVAGYRSGAMVYGDIYPNVHYSAGAYDYPLYRFSGNVKRDFVRLPVVRLGWLPCRTVSVDYMIASPELARTFDNGAALSRRLYLHDVAVTYDNRRWYRGSLEYFHGVDTAEVALMQMLHEGYGNNVAYSLYSAHSFTLNLRKKKTLRLTTAGEFLNGLDLVYEQYVHRPYYYALTQDAQLMLGKGVTLELSYDMRVNERLHGFKFQRIAAQLNFAASDKVNSSGIRNPLGRDEVED